MQKIVVVLLLFPFALFAQLDRIRTDMTETEFKTEFPEAKRDLDAEAVWVNEATTINGVEGNSLWRIYNDTVSEYRFNSVKVQGPCSDYPKADSAAVHKLRLCAEQLTAELTKGLGQPFDLESQSLLVLHGEKTLARPHTAYIAIWIKDDVVAKVIVSTELSTGNFINAPGKYTVVEAEFYELKVEITDRSAFCMKEYGVGMDDDAFFKSHVNCSTQVPVNRNHIYTIADSATCNNAQWEFTFRNGMLLYFTYKAYLGVDYGSKSEGEAYLKAKAKADLLLMQGNESGKSSEQSYDAPVTYKPGDLQTTYSKTHIHAIWPKKGGNVTLDFMENGGGKSPEIVFYIQVHFEFTP